MKLNQLISLNAILFIALGIAFALYGPVMLAFFGVSEIESNNAILYWTIASFARMFGAVLFGFGLLLWAIRSESFIQAISPEIRRGIIFAMLLSNSLAAIVSFTQAWQIWLGFAGWLITGIFVLLLLAYTYLLITGQKSATTSQPVNK